MRPSCVEGEMPVSAATAQAAIAATDAKNRTVAVLRSAVGFGFGGRSDMAEAGGRAPGAAGDAARAGGAYLLLPWLATAFILAARASWSPR